MRQGKFKVLCLDGDCTSAEPSRFKVVAHSKWSAWKSMEGMSKEDSMKMYVKKLQSVDASFAAVTQPKEAPAEKEVEVTTMKTQDDGRAGSEGMSTFGLSILLSLGIAGLGLTGFLFSTLSTPALFFLSLFAGGRSSLEP